MNESLKTITALLTNLHVLMPPVSIILVGAGSGHGHLTKWLILNAKGSITTLVEADVDQFSGLERMVATHKNSLKYFKLFNVVIAERTGEVSFFLASSVMENGLIAPESMRDFWPNLQTVKMEKRHAVTVGDLLEETEKDISNALHMVRKNGTGHWLLIDCLPAARLLPAKDELALFDVIVVRVIFKIEKSPVVRPEGTGLESISQILQEAGMMQFALEATLHPSIGYAIFVRDKNAEVQRYKNSYQETLVIIENLKKNTKMLEEQVEALQKNQNSEVCKSLGQLEKNLIQNLEKGFEVQARVIDRGLKNSVRQLESFLGIQEFFSTGKVMASFHGWPISPDIGMFLLTQIYKKRYDFIIEFGSGTSTLLFAKAAEALNANAHNKLSKSLEVMTFESDEYYYNQTLEMLKSQKLDKIVNLVHAPLVPWEMGGNDYFYYDCKKSLMELATKHQDKKLNILIFVDGPPGSTCKNARYPAVPCVVNSFSNHCIDVVLDDSNRPEEKNTIKMWKEFLDAEGISAENVYSDVGEKGIYSFEIRRE